jgi:hypothetical protein
MQKNTLQQPALHPQNPKRIFAATARGSTAHGTRTAQYKRRKPNKLQPPMIHDPSFTQPQASHPPCPAPPYPVCIRTDTSPIHCKTTPARPPQHELYANGHANAQLQLLENVQKTAPKPSQNRLVKWKVSPQLPPSPQAHQPLSSPPAL